MRIKIQNSFAIKNSKLAFKNQIHFYEVFFAKKWRLGTVWPLSILSTDNFSSYFSFFFGPKFFTQVVYSRDGSLHINKYGYLCDDNGLLLISDGTHRSSDPNAKHHIHVPSRAEDILVTPTGKIMAVELGGATFSKLGQITLARFENPQGLNIRLKMQSNCDAANEDGFALGNWCACT